MLTILQVIFALLLIAVILMQRKGTGLGAAFGGGGTVRYQKRGAEKVLHTATIAIAIIFVGLLIADIFIS